MKAVRAAWWVWALVPFLVVSCVLLASCSAIADERKPSVSTTDSNGTRVTLYDEPCYQAPTWLGWRKASMLYQGKIYEACWRVFGSTVIVLDSEVDASPVPMARFKRDDSV